MRSLIFHGFKYNKNLITRANASTIFYLIPRFFLLLLFFLPPDIQNNFINENVLSTLLVPSFDASLCLCQREGDAPVDDHEEYCIKE